MVARAGDDAAAAQKVKAAIADMRPERVTVLHDAGHQDGARILEEAPLFRFAHDRSMRRAERASQELAWIGELGGRLALEGGAEDIDCDLRRDLAVQMP